MTTPDRWANIPVELRERAQWCFTYPGDPLPHRRKAPRKKGNILASDTNPSDWMEFEEACAEATKFGGHIGYILTEDDPFTCIDMDVKDATTDPGKPEKWTTSQDFDRYWRICQTFECYTEKSASGKGLHIWARGSIGKGAKRDGVEVYSKERFMICTGDVVMYNPIEDRQELLAKMVNDIRKSQGDQHGRIELVEEAEIHSDLEIIERAMYAANGDKFNSLCIATSCVGEGSAKIHGTYQDLGYATQSEADLALMSMFTFYSASNEQCRRLFRMSYLGQRPKAVDDDRYLDFTLKLIRGRQAETEKLDVFEAQRARMFAEELALKEKERQASLPLHVLSSEPVTSKPTPTAAAIAQLAPVNHAQVADADRTDALPWPPGLTGEIAKYIFSSAPRPVREVAIVSAIGLMSGICGKAFNIPQSGLNMYVVLVARSAIGKEAMHSGVSAINNAVAEKQPRIGNYIDFGEPVSGVALKKKAIARACCLNLWSEWGRRLSTMADEKFEGQGAQLRTVMTELYQKSAHNNTLGGMDYSKEENNIASATGVAYSMIGESTPERFYGAMTKTMMEDGFMSRFLTIEYTGLRPPLNEDMNRAPSKALVDSVAELVTRATALSDRAQVQFVGSNPEAKALIRDFELICDANVNSSDDETYRQMHNRASLKVMRLAALLAVGANWVDPVITPEHFAWANDVVLRDIGIMSRRIQEGSVGDATEDLNREKRVVDEMKVYLSRPVPASYKTPDDLRKNGIITRKFMQMKLSRLIAFSNHPQGTTKALDATLASLAKQGWISEVPKEKLLKDFQYTGQCYRIIDLPDYESVSKS